jgi:flagellar biosynthesis component FlhA
MSDDQVDTKILGTPIAVKGIGALVVVVLAGALFATGWLFMKALEQSQQFEKDIAERHGEAMFKMEQRSSQEHNALLESLQTLKTVNEDTNKAIDEQSYIILADPKEQNEIKDKLRMPESLRDKIDMPRRRNGNHR